MTLVEPTASTTMGSIASRRHKSAFNGQSTNNPKLVTGSFAISSNLDNPNEEAFQPESTQPDTIPEESPEDELLIMIHGLDNGESARIMQEQLKMQNLILKIRSELEQDMR